MMVLKEKLQDLAIHEFTELMDAQNYDQHQLMGNTTSNLFEKR